MDVIGEDGELSWSPRGGGCEGLRTGCQCDGAGDSRDEDEDRVAFSPHVPTLHSVTTR